MGPGVRISDGDRIVEKNFWGPRKFCRLSWDQGFEYVTETGSWKKTFGAPKSFFLRSCRDQGFEYVTGDRIAEKHFLGPQKFFSIATKSGMTASAYLVNFKINLGDLAEVALIWPENIKSFERIKGSNLNSSLVDERLFKGPIAWIEERQDLTAIFPGTQDVDPGRG